MGWSCGQGASLREQAISDACVKSTGHQNVFKVGNEQYWFEQGRRERDGAITGQVFKYIGGELSKRSGSYRIEGNGLLTTGPKWMKNIPFKILEIDGHQSLWRGTTDLHTYLKGPYIKQFMPGGVNGHLKVIPYPKRASIMDENGVVLESFEAAMFEVW